MLCFMHSTSLVFFLLFRIVWTSKLSELFSASLVECFDDTGPSGYEQIMYRYFTEGDFKPEVKDSPWPKKLDNEVLEVFRNTLTVGIPYFELEPSFFFEEDSIVWKGYEHDLLAECVFPTIKDHYGLDDSEFQYEIKVFPQDLDDFFDSFYEKLEAGKAHFFTTVTYFEYRDEKIDYSHFHTVSYQMCIRSKYQEHINLTTYENVNKNSTKIFCLAGATYYWASDHFPAATVGQINEGDLLYQSLLDPEGSSKSGHLYCTSADSGFYFLTKNNLIENYTVLPESVAGKFPDVLGWGFLEDDEEENRAWIGITVGAASFAFCCCCIILCLPLIVFSCVVILSPFCCSLAVLSYLLLKRKAYPEEDIFNLKSENSVNVVLNKSLFVIDYSSIKCLHSIGQGGSTATVFLARWKGQKVAFKCYRCVFESQSRYREFEKEAEILMGVSHPFILKCYGATIQEPRVGVVLEYCSNGDLKHYFRKPENSEPYESRLRICLEIASAMDYLHVKSYFSLQRYYY